MAIETYGSAVWVNMLNIVVAKWIWHHTMGYPMGCGSKLVEQNTDSRELLQPVSSGYVNIAIENGPWNSESSRWIYTIGACHTFRDLYMHSSLYVWIPMIGLMTRGPVHLLLLQAQLPSFKHLPIELATKLGWNLRGKGQTPARGALDEWILNISQPQMSFFHWLVD